MDYVRNMKPVAWEFTYEKSAPWCRNDLINTRDSSNSWALIAVSSWMIIALLCRTRQYPEHGSETDMFGARIALSWDCLSFLFKQLRVKFLMFGLFVLWSRWRNSIFRFIVLSCFFLSHKEKRKEFKKKPAIKAEWAKSRNYTQDDVSWHRHFFFFWIGPPPRIHVFLQTPSSHISFFTSMFIHSLVISFFFSFFWKKNSLQCLFSIVFDGQTLLPSLHDDSFHVFSHPIYLLYTLTTLK